ncbi:MAG: TIGR01212 family radical SAM protein [Planctomycetes bacterium]|nr:TIGR01212 family radical SAM protein [Planctomycetota bacterium]
MNAAARFRTFGEWTRERFGAPLHRVALDAGSACPNRDGTKGYGGCVYCDVEGSGTGALREGADLSAQLRAGLQRVARRKNAGPAIAYFQSYSNTYVSTERLEEVLSVVEPHVGREVVAISVATRPDTLPERALDVLARWNERLPVWVELGLECADDTRLVEIHRLHTVAEFEDAVRRTRARGLLVIGHAILGLPGDGREGARRTAEVLARTLCEGVKVHQLMVLRKTVLERLWRAGRVELLDEPTYVDWLADFVERLGPTQVLHRLQADAEPPHLVAPLATPHASALRERLAAELTRRGTRQGEHCSARAR